MTQEIVYFLLRYQSKVVSAQHPRERRSLVQMLFFKGSTTMLIAVLTSFNMVLAALSYCHCSCAKNTTLIILDGTPSMRSCQDCTRDLCIEQAPQVCAGDKNGESVAITTNCFQRESRKDESIVILFLLLTGSLLLYAIVAKPLLEARKISREAQYGNLPTQDQR